MTPIEIYDGILVKREDLCFSTPAPPFSKCRGVVKYLTKLKLKGVKIVGYTETAISMAGWAVAWACKDLGLTAVIFDPQYENTPETLLYHRSKWKEFGAIVYPIPAGRAKVGWYQSKKLLERYYGRGAKLLPLGLPFKETIEETEKELLATLEQLRDEQIRSIVICIGSGTIAAGVYKGLCETKSTIFLYGIMCREGGAKNKQRTIERKAGVVNEGFFKPTSNLIIIDEGYEYTEKAKAEAPFPCNPFYDLKAWKYLIDNRYKIEEKILFWNIGS